MRRTHRGLLLGLSIAAVITVHALAEESRTWSDAKGKFKITAKYVSQDDGKVTLEKADGSTLEIELKKLGPADQKYVADLEKKQKEMEKNGDNPFKAKEDSPFKAKEADPFKPKTGAGGGGASKEKPKEKESGDFKTELKILTSDLSNVRDVSLTQPNEPWKFEVTPPKEVTPPAKEITKAAKDKAAKDASKAVLIPISKKLDFWEYTKAFVGCQSQKFAAIGYTLDKKEVKGSRIVICDLEKNKQISDCGLLGIFVPLALHNDGKRLLMRRDVDGHKDEMEVWTINGKKGTRGQSWMPYDNLKAAEREIIWSAFGAEETFLTMNKAGLIVAWKMEDLQPMYKVQTEGHIPAISPDQKWLAFTLKNKLVALDLKEGEVSGMQTLPMVFQPKLAFSPAGTRLALHSINQLFVWDFATGELYRELPYYGTFMGWELTWSNEDFVLIGHRYLIDLENQVRVWDYRGGEFAEQLGGTTWFVCSDGDRKPGALLGAQLPPPALQKLLAKAIADDDFFIVKPGTSMKIDVSGLDPSGRTQVEKMLTARIEELGFEEDADAEVLLLASSEIGQEYKIDYHLFGRGIETHSVRNYITHLKLMYKGKEIWRTAQSNGAPGFLILQGNQTIAEVLKNSAKFYFDWYAKADIPKLLQRPKTDTNPVPGAPPVESITLGVTQLTATGAR